MRRKLIVGNWKMHGTRASLAEAAVIAAAATGAPHVDVALCPPATLIGAMAAVVPAFAVGAQDCHDQPSGAFTGSIAASMLADAGARLTIVGHSERREALGESNALVRAKALAALAAGLDVILCVGEPRSIRESAGAESYVLSQLAASLPEGDARDPARIAIAYEPIWAIGSGRTPSMDDIAGMHSAIRGWLGRTGDMMRILYGGSVNADNAAAILDLSNVDGALVGGASLTQAQFVPIIEAAARV